MKAKIRNMEPVYSGRCHKCMTEVEDVKKSEMQSLSILHFFRLAIPYGAIKCPNPKCNARIELLLEQWKEPEKPIDKKLQEIEKNIGGNFK